MDELICTDRSGTMRTFYLQLVEKGGHVTCMVHASLTPVADDDFYEGQFDRVQDCLQASVLHSRRPYHGHRASYEHKGITPALLAFLAGRFPDLRVCSSSNAVGAKRLRRESRSIDATRVWNGLVERGSATYVEAEDRYYYVTRPTAV